MSKPTMPTRQELETNTAPLCQRCGLAPWVCTCSAQADAHAKPSDIDIRRGLERRYGDGWLLLHEVASGIGHMPSRYHAKLAAECGDVLRTKRYLDAVAIGMYQSTHHEIIGHEIKVTRSDWLAELRDPSKAGAFDGLLSRFYVVAPAKVVKPDELPTDWGLIEWHASRMMTKVKAKIRRTEISHAWVAALLARAVKPAKKSTNHT